MVSGPLYRMAGLQGRDSGMYGDTPLSRCI